MNAEENPRRRLGRGLAALMGDVSNEPAFSGRETSRARGPRRLPTAFLRPNPRNPRRNFSETDLEDLTRSVKEKGVVQPILVRPLSDPPDTFEIIAGERRWRAAQRAGLHEVPVVVLELSDREALEVAIIENVQRTDLNPLEEALGYERLISEFGYSQSDLAGVIGKSRSHVANTLRLLRLPEPVQAMLADGRLTAGHARALITAQNPTALAERIVAGDLSVREAEALANGSAASTRRPGGRPRRDKDADTRALEQRLAAALGLTVDIVPKDGERGEVRIRYATLEQLDDVCRRLTVGGVPPEAAVR